MTNLKVTRIAPDVVADLLIERRQPLSERNAIRDCDGAERVQIGQPQAPAVEELLSCDR
jgi:hypothetical protein